MKPQLPFIEFVLLIALLFSLIAFGTDAMLPALPEIGRDLGLADVNRAQLVITSFILGTGLGQLIMGPLSDAWGRKPVLIIGFAVFFAGCIAAYWARSLDVMLLARFVQGLGIAAPRTVTVAMVRDMYAGRLMARVISLAMMVFVIAPAMAPAIGQEIMQAFGWRSIYVSFVVMAGVALVWLVIRQPETHPENRRSELRLGSLAATVVEVLRHRVVVTYTACLSLAYGALFAFLSSAQQIFVDWLGVGDRFPLYFAVIALLSGGASFLNALLVVRLGMRVLATNAFAALAVISAGVAIMMSVEVVPSNLLLPVFLAWGVSQLFLLSLCFANLNALALEPMGHIAGTASAIVGAIATAASVLIAIPIGQLFDGTGIPLMTGAAVCGALGWVLMLTNPKDA